MRAPLSITLALFPLVLAPAVGQAPAGAGSDPMAVFEALVGRWEGADGSSHEFGWGLERKTLLSRTYVPGADGDRMTSEARWFWHPAEGTVLGHAVAVGMPFEVLEMRASFDGEHLRQELRAVAADGSVSEYRETWAFDGEDRYTWSLFAGEQKIMEGTYQRVDD